MKKFILPLMFVALAFAVSCSSWGEKVEHNKGEVYYKEPVTKVQADALGKYLADIGYFDGVAKSVQVLKNDNYYTVNFVVKEGADKNPDNVATFKSFSPILSYSVFNGELVNIGMCDAEFKTLQLIAGFNYGKQVKFGNDELYYEKPVTKEQIDKLGAFLRESGFFQGTGLQAQLKKEGNLYQFRYVVKTGLENDESYKATVKAFGSLISSGPLNNEKVDIHLCDNFFNTLTTVIAE